MYAVLDTNQALRLPRTGVREGCGLTLAPYVIAEILLRPDPGPTVRRIRAYEVRLGLQVHEVFDKLAPLYEDDIPHLQPFVQTGSLIAPDSFYAGLYPELSPWLETVRNKAAVAKEAARAFCGSMLPRSVNARKLFTSLGGAPKFRNLDEAVRYIDVWPECVADIVSSASKRRLAVSDPRRLYSAVMSNQFLARFFKSILCFQLSWFRLWDDQSLNFDPSSQRDDFTDLTLPLYAGNGDVILTEDKKVQRLLGVVDPDGVVRVAAARDL